jgi:hypothetical protein
MGNVYKDEITKLLRAYVEIGTFAIPPMSHKHGREECLKLENDEGQCRADFCYYIRPSGRLFIEDDDSPRGLNNLVKYWRWSRLNEDIHPVYLVHILNTDRGVWANHCKFIGMRMEEEMGRKKFRYLPMSVDNKWHDHETWLPHLKNILDEVSQARTCGASAGAH